MMIDQNILLVLMLTFVVLGIYYLMSFTTKGRTTSRTFRKNERKWLKQEKKLFMKIIKWLLLPATIIWIIIDVAFVAIANYYFHNVIFEPIFGLTPMQTLIATILLLFLGYLLYRTYIRGAKK